MSFNKRSSWKLKRNVTFRCPTCAGIRAPCFHVAETSVQIAVICSDNGKPHFCFCHPKTRHRWLFKVTATNVHPVFEFWQLFFHRGNTKNNFPTRVKFNFQSPAKLLSQKPSFPIALKPRFCPVLARSVPPCNILEGIKEVLSMLFALRSFTHP